MLVLFQSVSFIAFKMLIAVIIYFFCISESSFFVFMNFLVGWINLSWRAGGCPALTCVVLQFSVTQVVVLWNLFLWTVIHMIHTSAKRNYPLYPRCRVTGMPAWCLHTVHDRTCSWDFSDCAHNFKKKKSKGQPATAGRYPQVFCCCCWVFFGEKCVVREDLLVKLAKILILFLIYSNKNRNLRVFFFFFT